MGYANVSETDAKAIVKGFRVTNPKVVALWRKLDEVIKTSAKEHQKRHLVAEMPSGEKLQYFDICASNGGGYIGYVVKGDTSLTSRQPRLWGGTLTENVTQRMARDILANSVVNLESAGIRVVFHAHDEVILEVPVDSKAEAKAEALRIMTTPPEWAPDLPLGVEGDFAEAYTK